MLMQVRILEMKKDTTVDCRDRETSAKGQTKGTHTKSAHVYYCRALKGTFPICWYTTAK